MHRIGRRWSRTFSAPACAALVAFAAFNGLSASPTGVAIDVPEANAADIPSGELALLANPLGPTYRPGDFELASLGGEAREAVDSVWTSPGDIPRLELDVDGSKYGLPLEHTAFDAQVNGHVARVEVTQTYRNPLSVPLEVVYVFPLPENSAVDAMRFRIDDRVVEAEIQRRADARATFEAAKEAGHTAALLEQERPNVFTQSVANIPAGASIEVTVGYVQDLERDGGEYELVMPMVVGPRFIPGEAVGKAGSGWSPDTTDVPDGSRITPPIVGSGMRTGSDISVRVSVESNGRPISDLRVPTHEVIDTVLADDQLAVTLAKSDEIPNRDFVMRWRVSGDNAAGAMASHRPVSGGPGFVTLAVHPPALDLDALVGQRELIFVVDVSGSMSGEPLSMATDAMRDALERMRPTDTFNIITFASSERLLWQASRPANDTNLKAASEFLRNLSAGGGTQLGDAVETALSVNFENGGRHRYVFFLTDGYVGNEDEILASTRTFVADFGIRAPALQIDGVTRSSQAAPRARVFAMGIGSSVNRHLLEGLGEAGQGATVYTTTSEDPTRAVNTFYKYIDHTILDDIDIDWGELDVASVVPRKPGALFATHPLIVHARLESADDIATTVTISGEAGGETVSLKVPVQVVAAAHGDPVHATLWARSRVGELERELWDGHDTLVADEITELGLEFGLVTPYTSFVAVDRSQTVADHEFARSVVQGVEAPDGVAAGESADGASVYVVEPAPEPRSGGVVKRKRKKRKKRVRRARSESAPIVEARRSEDPKPDQKRDQVRVPEPRMQPESEPEPASDGDEAGGGSTDGTVATNSSGSAGSGSSATSRTRSKSSSSSRRKRAGSGTSSKKSATMKSESHAAAAANEIERKLRKKLKRRKPKIEACYTDHGGQIGKGKLRIRVIVENGAFAAVVVTLRPDGAQPGTQDPDACIEDLVRRTKLAPDAEARFAIDLEFP